MIKTVKIPVERAEEMRALSVEVESRKAIIQQMIQDRMDISNDSFKSYQEEYQKHFLNYEKAKAKLQKDFVESDFDNPIRWELDFETSELKVELAE